MIKVIFSDLDGTLLKDGKIPSVTFSAIKKIMGMGVKFGIVTGKSVDDYLKLNLSEKINGPAIVENGVVILSGTDEKNIPDGGWLNKIKGELDDLKNVEDTLKEDYKIYRKNMSFTIDLNESPGVMDKLSKIEMQNLKAKKNGDWLDFFPKMAGKGNAIEYYCKEKGIDMEDVCAIGDDENDIEMLSKVGLPCVIKNSPDKLKSTIGDKDCIISTKESYLGGREILKELLKNYLS